MQTDTHAHRHTDRLMDRWVNGQASDSRTDRQTADRQMDRTSRQKTNEQADQRNRQMMD